MWHALAQLASDRHGLVHDDDLRRLGIIAGADRRALRRFVREGRLEKVTATVWRVAGSPVTWRQRLHAGLLTLPAGSCVSHDAAAQLHGLDRTPADRVEFTVLRPRRTARLPERVHTTRHLGQADVVVIDGLRTTSATRTIIDLARARVGTARLQAAIDSSVRSGASAPAVIQRRLADLRGPGRWGCRLVDRLLVHSGGHTMLERYFLELMAEQGLPRPEPQVVFRDERDRTLARVDFLFREWSIVVEVTGALGHAEDRDRSRDAQRRNELQDIGLNVYEYTWSQVRTRATWVKETMEARLRRAGWRPSGSALPGRQPAS